jgi:uncharacterized SAM-binding protein YcdF (DUF218 family)
MLNWIRYLGYLGEMVGLLWLLQILGTLFLLWRRKLTGAIVLGSLAALTFIIGGTPLPARWLAHLEAPYVRTNLASLPACDVVVILGGGHQPSEFDTFGLGLNSGADRFVTGLELMRLQKGRALVVGGGAYTRNGQKYAYGDLLRKWFETWGMPKTPIYTLGLSLTTREEALEFQKLAQTNGWRNALLVTSAFHCRRAEAAFKNVGISAFSVGCDFRSIGIQNPENRAPWIPRRERLDQMDFWLHETIGWFIYSWRGWTQDNTPQKPAPEKNKPSPRDVSSEPSTGPRPAASGMANSRLLCCLVWGHRINLFRGWSS